MNGSCIKDIELISVLPFWEHLSDNQKKYAANHTVIRHYEKDSMIYSSESMCLGMVCM